LQGRLVSSPLLCYYTPMKPWEDKKTREKMRTMSGARSVRIFFELYKGAIEMVRGSLAGRRRKSKKALRLELDRLSRTIGCL
jgi:hypothetical protein